MTKIGQGIRMSKVNETSRKRLLILLVVGAFILTYFWYKYKLNPCPCQIECLGQQVNQTNGNNRKINMENENLPIQMKSVMNFPEWFRNNDWGLKQNVTLQNVQVEFRGLDKEEGTAWEKFFFGTTKGLVLELGAMDGNGYSVSAFFENKANWRTILIEGNPKLATMLPMNRPKALNFNYVICDKPRVVHYITKSWGADGILEFMTGEYLRGIHPGYLGPDGKLNMKTVESAQDVIKVDCVPLTQILLSFNITHINFFLLDVEGGEFNVLKTIDFDKITFDVIAVETDRGTDTKENTKKYVDDVIELLKSKGYEVWERKLGRNSWFVHSNFEPFRQIANMSSN